MIQCTYCGKEIDTTNGECPCDKTIFEQRQETASAVDTIVKYTIKPLAWTKKGKTIYADGTGYYIDLGHSSYYVGNANGDFAVTRGLDRAKEIASERYKAGLQKHLIECT